MNHHTRLRVYHTGVAGSSSSLIVDNHFTLIGAKVTDANVTNIREELKLTGKDYIDVLHIPNWDVEHCDEASLRFILSHWSPRLIEYPAYHPDSDAGLRCLSLIDNYSLGEKMDVVPWKVYYSQQRAKVLENRDIFFSPIHLGENKCNNSIVKLFRRGSFQILSLGSIPSVEICQYLKENEILRTEVDVLFMNGNNSKNNIYTTQLFEAISPHVVITTFDHLNEQTHQIAKNYGYKLGISYFFTDTCDVIGESVDSYSFKTYYLTTNYGECKECGLYRNKLFYPND